MNQHTVSLCDSNQHRKKLKSMNKQLILKVGLWFYFVTELPLKPI